MNGERSSEEPPNPAMTLTKRRRRIPIAPVWAGGVAATALTAATALAAPLWGDHLLSTLKDLFFLSLITFTSQFLGSALLHRLCRQRGDVWEGWVLSVPLGLGLLSVIIFLLGITGLLYRASIIALMAVALATYLPRLKGSLSRLREELAVRREWSGWELTTLAAIIAVVALNFIAADTPPTSRDALAHHLAIPKLYIKEHRIVEVPFAVFSYYPMNLEMLFTAGMLLSSDILPKLIHLLFYILNLAAVALFGGRRFGRLYGLLGALILGTIPVVCNLAGWAYVDLGLSLYTFLSLASLLNWRDEQDGSWLRLAALFCGLAVGVKYNGLIVLLLLSGGVILTGHRMKGNAAVPADEPPSLSQPSGGPGRSRSFGESAPPRRRNSAIAGWLKPAGAFLLIAIIVSSPWFVKNAIQTGNPTYPLLTGLFGGREWQPERMEFPPWALRRELYGMGWADEISLPILLSVKREHIPDFGIDGPLGPALLIGIVLFLLSPLRRDEGMRHLLYFALFYYLIAWSLWDMRVRYLVPILPPLALLTAGSVAALRRVGRLRGWLALASISAALTINLAWTLDQVAAKNPFPYAAGQEGRRDYLACQIQDYPAFEFMNSRLPSSARVMFLFTGNDGYYLDRDYIYDTYYQDYTIKKILGSSTTGAEVRDRLLEMRVTHLFVNWRYLRMNFASSLGDEERGLFREFVESYLVPLYRIGDEGVYEIREG